MTNTAKTNAKELTQELRFEGALADFAREHRLNKDKAMKAILTQVFTDHEPSQEELIVFLGTCNKYELDPFIKQIYPAFSKKGNLLPIISVDGWFKLLHRQEKRNGETVTFSEETVTLEFTKLVGQNQRPVKVFITGPVWCKVAVHIQDMQYPIEITEYFSDCCRCSDSWQTHPYRMLRHKTYIQAIRAAFSFAGVYDEDEYKRICESEVRQAIDMGKAEVVNQDDGKEPEQNPAPAPIATVVPPPVVERKFTSDEQLESFVSKILARCAEKDVFDEAYDFVKERLKGESLVYAIQRLDEAKAQREGAAWP